MYAVLMLRFGCFKGNYDDYFNLNHLFACSYDGMF